MTSSRIIDATLKIGGEIAFIMELDDECALYTVKNNPDHNWEMGPKIKFEAVSIAQFNGATFVLGREGELMCFPNASPPQTMQPIAKSGVDGPFRKLHATANTLYALSSDRLVWQTAADFCWTVSSPATADGNLDLEDYETLVLKIANETQIWFDIAAGPARNLYAVGTGGEIYILNTNGWHQIESPTNLNFYAIARCENGEYVVGGNQILLKGVNNSWIEICSDLIDGEVQSIAEFGKNIYVVTTEGVFVVTPHEEVVALDPELFSSLPFRILTDNVSLVVLCENQILRTQDGVTFTPVFTSESIDSPFDRT